MADPTDRIASAVSDGKRVDWVREKTKRPDRLEEFDQLALVERIRCVHDSASPDEPTTGAHEPDDVSTVSIHAAEPAPKPIFHWGRLEVLQRIGEGASGEVYRALDPSLRSTVALKLLRPDYADSPQLIKRFLDEGRRLARVRHHNVLMVHGADQHDGRAGLWTEFVRGKSLERYIEEQGPLSACEAAVIGLDLCRALAAVHAAGLVHRDVKTKNVMREDGGRIILMDFGSVAESPSAGSGRWTAGVQGTPIFMAPEQLRGEVAGPATDVYGLGVLLYRLVTRKFPIEASSYHELSEKHRRGAQVPLRDRRPDLPLEFVQVVERALRPEPGERYASTGAMERDLSATLGSIARRHEQRRRTNRIALAAVATVAVVAGVFIGVAVRDQVGGTVATPPPAVEQAPPAPVPLEADLTLLRRADDGDTDQPLAPGGRVALGDLLSLLVKGSDSMYVYVLDEDEQGEVYGLYPIQGLVPMNPLDGHVEHRLPGDFGGKVIYWNVTSAGGRESIIAIGSRTPLPNLESVMADLPQATPGRPVRFGKVNPMALRTLRGIGEGTPMEPPKGEARRRLKTALEALAARGAESGNIWVWTIELENPTPAP